MRRKAFTLVELLVVIGIIAVLVGILLPALNAARKSANAVKCAASMREIGNAVQMYALENHQFYPPLHVYFGGSAYNINGVVYAGATNPAYWYNFLTKYVTKTNVGYAATTPGNASQGMASVFWGCPAWTAYSSSSTNAINQGGQNIVQTGYGWNGFPEYTPSFPEPLAELGETTPTPSPQYSMDVAIPASTDNWKTFKFSNTSNSPFGKWYKQNAYKTPADRALVGDASFYVLESRPPNTTAGSNTIYPQATLGYTLWAGAHGANQSTFDVYRHGKYPPINATDNTTYSMTGGKIAFNVLFCDGHVAMQNAFDQAYKTIRMRFPD